MQSVDRPSPCRNTASHRFSIGRAAPTLLAALCLFATAAGCQSHRSARQVRAESAGSHTQVFTIPDPTFGGMPAATITVPAGWKTQGQTVYSSCLDADSPGMTIDTASPDGQEEFSALPRYEWRWGMGAQFARGCAPLNGIPKAAEFLKLFASKLPGKVQIVGDMPVSEKYRSDAQNAVAGAIKVQERVAEEANRRYPQNARKINEMMVSDITGDVAAVRAIDDSGHELELRVWTLCRQNSHQGSCSAMVSILRAPKGRLDALAARLESPDMFKLTPIEKWQTASFERTKRQFEANQAAEQRQFEAVQQQGRDATAAMQQQHNAFMQQQNSYNQHQAYMQQQHQSFANHTQAWAAGVNARSTAASDWRDYAADQQTVSGANGTYKTSSQYSNVWSSPYGPALSNGRTFGSTDKTANPNSATDNTWTQDHKVHGNGQPY